MARRWLYRYLGTPKDEARGVGAVMGMFQLRIFAYVALGAFRREDVPLHCVAAVLHVLGTALGSVMAGAWFSQARFMQFMLVLMVVSCALLFAAAAGVTAS